MVVNVHHFANQVEAYLASHRWGTEVLVSDERRQLLDTGGAIGAAAHLFESTMNIAVHNVDVLSTLRLLDLELHMAATGADAVLAVSRRQTSRQLLFDANGHLAGWRNAATGEERWVDAPQPLCTPLAFSGIALYTPHLVAQLPKTGLPYPIVPELLRLARTNVVVAYEHAASEWLDVGKPETLPLAEQFITSHLL